MHRIAIGDPQCVRHELFTKLRIRMVDGESVWREFYPRDCGSPGLTGCGYCRCLVEIWNCVHVDISLGHAQGKRARYGDAQAIIRCGEPVQLQLSGFLACNRAEQPVWRGP
jgi:hypothetical protein